MRTYVICVILFGCLVEVDAGKKNREGKKNKEGKVKKAKIGDGMPDDWKTARWSPDPEVEEEELRTFDTHPLVIQAEKLAHLTPDQNVVSTCRYILFKDMANFHEAENTCENLNWPVTHRGKAELATVQNEDENNAVKTLIRAAFGFHTVDKEFSNENWAFIGLSKRTNNTFPLEVEEMGNFSPDDWYYQDNQKPKYWNFVYPNPDQEYRGEGDLLEYQNFIAINKKGLWDDTYSTRELPFVCQYCGRYVIMSHHARWDEAQGHCESAGLQFATINSQEDNDELWYAVNKTLSEIIFDPRFNDTNWVWIGEKENQVTKQWEHYDGSQFADGYHPVWDFDHQPDDMMDESGETQSVVAISRRDGKWDDSFPYKERPFACMCPPETCSATG